MFTEYSFPRELDGDLIKRWCTDEFFDLFVWFDKRGEIASFQLCYDKPRDKQAFTWKRPSTITLNESMSAKIVRGKTNQRQF